MRKMAIVSVLALSAGVASANVIIYDDGFVASGWGAGSDVTEATFQAKNMLHMSKANQYFWGRICDGTPVPIADGLQVVLEVWNDNSSKNFLISKVHIDSGSYWGSPSVDGRPDGYSDPQPIAYGQWDQTSQTASGMVQLGAIQFYVDSADNDLYIRKIYVTPEPATMSLLGLGGLGLLIRRKR